MPNRKPLFRRRKLPHWDVPGATYFITSCLEGSMPAQGLLRLNQYRKQLEARPKPDDMSPDAWDVHRKKLVFAKFDNIVDQSPAVMHLKDPDAASKVRESILHFAGERYDLYAYVVMSSHFHWVFKPRDEWIEILAGEGEERPPRQIIMHSLKRFTARQCNLILGRNGTFWQEESYDHCVREDEDQGELERIIDYVEMNSVKAGLVSSSGEWPWSSARDRLEWGIPKGEPLVRPSV
ncbi:MAG: hypothetical protein O3B01_06740 [Planctomycetota bacterium]|nr:hypothetical protein [Planctomycetota bacterium]